MNPSLRTLRPAQKHGRLKTIDQGAPQPPLPVSRMPAANWREQDCPRMVNHFNLGDRQPG